MQSAATNSIHLFENGNFKLFNNLVVIVGRIVLWTDKLFGLIGIVLAAPFLLLLVLGLTAELVRLNSRMYKIIRKVNNFINYAPENQIIKLHLEAEAFNLEMKAKQKFLVNPNVYFLKPLINQLTKLTNLINELEMTLYKAAYPEIHNEPTKEQQTRLLKIFSEEEDWYDSDLDDYDAVYIK